MITPILLGYNDSLTQMRGISLMKCSEFHMDIEDMLKRGKFTRQERWPGISGCQPSVINGMKTRPTIFGVRAYKTDKACMFRFTDDGKSVDCGFSEYEKGDLIICRELDAILYVSLNKRYLVDAGDGGGSYLTVSTERDYHDPLALTIRAFATMSVPLNLDSMACLARVLMFLTPWYHVDHFRIEIDTLVGDHETFGGILPDPSPRIRRDGWRAILVYNGDVRCGVPFGSGYLRFRLEISMPTILVAARDYQRNIMHEFARCTPDMFLLDIDEKKPRFRQVFYAGYKPLAQLKRSFFIAGEVHLPAPVYPKFIEKSTERSLKWRDRWGICARADAFPDELPYKLKEGDYAAPLGETFECVPGSHRDLILVYDERCHYYWSWPHYVLSLVTPVLADLGLNSFVILWIADWWPYMVQWPALEKLRTIESLMASRERVREKRIAEKK